MRIFLAILLLFGTPATALDQKEWFQRCSQEAERQMVEPVDLSIREQSPFGFPNVSLEMCLYRLAQVCRFEDDAEKCLKGAIAAAQSYVGTVFDRLPAEIDSNPLAQRRYKKDLKSIRDGRPASARMKDFYKRDDESKYANNMARIERMFTTQPFPGIGTTTTRDYWETWFLLQYPLSSVLQGALNSGPDKQ